MALSTEIPRATLKIIMVEGFIGTPVKPIIAAVIMSGIMLGIIETRIIRNEENSKAIRSEMRIMAIVTLSNCYL